MLRVEPAAQERPEPVPPVKPGSLAAVFVEHSGADPAHAHRLATIWASEMLIEPDEARAWLRAGMNSYDAHVVDALRHYGVTPALMTTVLRGESMLDRMRLYGYGPDKVAATLREAGLLRSTA